MEEEGGGVDPELLESFSMTSGTGSRAWLDGIDEA